MTQNRSPYGDTQIAVACDCHSPHHTFTLGHSSYEGEEPFVYMHAQMHTHKSFWKRLWYGMKYAFGGSRGVYGDWDEVLISHDNLVQLRAFCDAVIEHNIDSKLRRVNFNSPAPTYLSDTNHN